MSDDHNHDEDVFMFPDNDGDTLHRVLCKALDVTPGHGSKSVVAELLGVRAQRYSRIIARPVCALEPTARLCRRAGVRMLIDDAGVVWFYAPNDTIID